MYTLDVWLKMKTFGYILSISPLSRFSIGSGSYPCAVLEICEYQKHFPKLAMEILNMCMLSLICEFDAILFLFQMVDQFPTYASSNFLTFDG